MTAQTDFDVVIAGGSYVGLALAAALTLRSHGDLRIAVASPSFPPPAVDDPVADVRCSALARGSLQLLENLGVWRGLSPDVMPVRRIEITDSGLADARRPVALTYDLVGSAPDALQALPAMAIVENAHLGAALRRAADAASNITLVHGSPVETMVESLCGIDARLADGRTLSARLLVAADGGRSRLRDVANIQTVEWPCHQVGIVTVVALARPHDGRAIQHFLPGGPFALLPLTGDRYCVTWSEEEKEARRILTLPPADFAAAVARRIGPEFGNIGSVSVPRGWPLRFLVARSLVAPRFALVGDAARTVHPIAGQGLNLGLRDAAALTDVIVGAASLGLDIGSDDTLADYQSRRRFDNISSVLAFDALNRVFGSGGTATRTLRTAGMHVLDAIPSLKSWLINEAAGETGDVPSLMRPEAIDQPADARRSPQPVIAPAAG